MVTATAGRAKRQRLARCCCRKQVQRPVPFTLAASVFCRYVRIHVPAVNDNQVDLVAYGQGAASVLSRVAQQLVGWRRRTRRRAAALLAV
jgi:hypothetical protein